MIRYKVVKLNFGNRYSCYVTGDYQLAYRKNTIVTAKEGTLGIAVFERRHQAENFMGTEFFSHHLYRIIRVISIGRGKRYRFVSPGQDDSSLNFFYREYGINLSSLLKYSPFFTYTMKSPPGTIFYQQVKVIE